MLPIVAALGATGALLVGSTTTATAATKPLPKTYTVTQTFGPFNGQANESNNLPGGVHTNGEGYRVQCADQHDAIVSGSATINRKTTHGTASSDVVNLDVLGAYIETDAANILEWGGFIATNGRKGWNTVTFKITCHR